MKGGPCCTRRDRGRERARERDRERQGERAIAREREKGTGREKASDRERERKGELPSAVHVGGFHGKDLAAPGFLLVLLELALDLRKRECDSETEIVSE